MEEKIYDNEVTISFNCPTDKKTHLTEKKIKKLLKPLIDYINEEGSIEESEIEVDIEVNLE